MARIKKSKSSEKSSSKASATSKKDTTLSIETTDPVVEYKLKDGVTRPFVLTTPPAELYKIRTVTTTKEKLVLFAVGLVALFFRFYRLSTPSSVVFDEVHFGGFARKYILGSYFMDVHPPLAKMLFAGVAFTFGFTGNFEFKNIGDEFPEDVPYIMMRAFSAGLGVGTVILCYLTLRASGCRVLTSAIGAFLLIIENATTTISRYILLDSPLLFFIAASVYALKKFENEIPFSLRWYKALFVAGIGLGCAVSSKWVGLFTIGWAGIYMIWQLWFIWGDLTVSFKKFTHHFLARGIILLGVPFLLYCAFFAMHFQILTNEGDGSAFMSSAFRATLNGNTIPKVTNAQVGLKSLVTLRHIKTQGGYLHSHDHLYETGSKQQQITLYPHLDDNNVWEIEYYNQTGEVDKFEPVTDGMKIRLKHKLTHRRLHSHNHRPPVTEQDWQNEVSAYGFEGFQGDANDDFIVEIQKPLSKKGAARREVHAIDTVFRLRHAMTGCYLFSHEVKLPKYAFEQQEVSCATQGIVPLSLWYIEVNENPFLNETSEKVSYKKLTFWDKFVESHQRMWHINNGLTSSHDWESRPPSWPILQRGINYWVKNHRQVYFLGNAVSWWASSAIIFVFICNVFAILINWQRGKPLITEPHFVNYNTSTFIYVIGWLIHYLPSFLMARQLFLHHYLPALYFQFLILGQTLDFFLTFFNKKTPAIAYVSFVIFCSAAFGFFYNYWPLVYGGEWTKSACENSKLLSTWDFDCNAFPNSLSDYASFSDVAEPPKSTTAPAPIQPAAENVEQVKEEPIGAELNNEQIIQQAPSPEGNVIRKYQDEQGNPIDPEVAEAYLKEHPEEVIKVETKIY